MLPTDRAEFARILTASASIKPGAKLTPAALDLWWNAMQHWRIDDFRAAASHLVAAVEFMPQPFHFEKLRTAWRMSAGEAFAAAVRHVRSGNYRRAKAAPAIERTVHAIGGWPAIAMSDESKLPFIERRFAEHFNTMQDADVIRAAFPQLLGRNINHLLDQS